METSRLKKFAIEARAALITSVVDRLKALGFGLDGNVKEKDRPEYVQGGAIFRGELKQGDSFYKKWTALEATIGNNPQGPKEGFKHVAEEAAYTWFNRFVAIRILQKNGLIEPQLAYAQDGKTPLIVDYARNGRLPNMNEAEKAEWAQLSEDDSKVFEQFALLIVAYCHTTPILEKCFGHIDDYTELLLPTNILSPGGFVDMLNTTDYITDEDYKHTELIGWLYQFYISDRKAEVFEGYKNKKKAEADDIPAATQIFTPNWIVKYMVQNTLGRIYLDNNKGSALAKDWKYLVETPESSPDAVYKYTDLESIKVADLGCGSGHILNEFFDMLYTFYDEEGYDSKEAIQDIFEKNMVGVDIDTRAKQLATFSLLLKACQKNRKFLDCKVMPKVLDMPEMSASYWNSPLSSQATQTTSFRAPTRNLFAEAFPFELTDKTNKELLDAFTLMGDDRVLGSIMKFKVSPETRDYMVKCLEFHKNHPEKFVDHEEDFASIFQSFELILILTQKYAAICMNPPYMGSGNMCVTLSDYVKANYPDSKTDLFAVFMNLAANRLADKGKYGMLNMQSWMFLSSFEDLRKSVLENSRINSMLHLGPRTFDELSGEVVQNTAFVISKGQSVIPGSDPKSRMLCGTYYRLVDGKDCSDKERMFLAKEVYYPNIPQKNFEKIPGAPIGYWVTTNALKIFDLKTISDSFIVRNGISTGDNTKYLRYWQEVSYPFVKWKPCNKGGEFRRWYGNNEYVVFWENNGYAIRTSLDEKGRIKARLGGIEYSFMEGIEMSRITTGKPGFRLSPTGFVYESSTNDIYKTSNEQSFYTLIGFCNTKITNFIISLINPTINIMPEDLRKIPFEDVSRIQVEQLVKQNIAISKSDWDAHETSWDFTVNEIVDMDNTSKYSDVVHEISGPDMCIDLASPNFGSLEWRLSIVKDKWRARFDKLHENEEELNRKFIEIYGLQDELTPDVPLSEITILQQGEISIEEE